MDDGWSGCYRDHVTGRYLLGCDWNVASVGFVGGGASLRGRLRWGDDDHICRDRVDGWLRDGLDDLGDGRGGVLRLPQS